jgi:hypothetical protein
MSTAGQRTRKKVIHPVDPLDDLDAAVHQDGTHTPYVLYDDTVTTPGYWADWVVQTVHLPSVSDAVEARGGTRFFTIAAVIFDDDADRILVTDGNGDRFRVPVSDIRLDGVTTTRH